MLVLTFYHRQNSITYTLYKLYNKKFIFQTKGIIELNSSNQISWQVFNIQQKPIIHLILDKDNKEQVFDYHKIFSHHLIADLKPNVIINKISVGGAEFNNICRLNDIILDKIANYNHLAPHIQPMEIALAKHSQTIFTQAKHYVCFNDSFHATIDKPTNIFFKNINEENPDIDFFGSSGLIFAGIADKIPDLTDKKMSRGKWIIIYLENNHTTLCAIKNGKSRYCTSSEIWHELSGFSHSEMIDPTIIHKIARLNNQPIDKTLKNISTYNLDNLTNNSYNSMDDLLSDKEINTNLAKNYYSQQISHAICKLGTILHGVNGIIFTGKIGQNNSEIRNMICNQLEWIGIELSNKANLENQTKLHKKDSKVQIFLLPAEAEYAMLKQLFERI